MCAGPASTCLPPSPRTLFFPSRSRLLPPLLVTSFARRHHTDSIATPASACAARQRIAARVAARQCLLASPLRCRHVAWRRHHDISSRVSNTRHSTDIRLGHFVNTALNTNTMYTPQMATRAGFTLEAFAKRTPPSPLFPSRPRLGFTQPFILNFHYFAAARERRHMAYRAAQSGFYATRHCARRCARMLMSRFFAVAGAG